MTAPRAADRAARVPAARSCRPAPRCCARRCSEVCGTDVHLWHGRLVRRAVSDHSRARVGRRHRRDARADHRHRRLRDSRKATGSSSSTSIARAGAAAPAPSTGRRRAARRAASTASPTPPTRGCSAAGRRRSTSNPASRWRACPTPVSLDDYIGGGCGLLTAVHIDRARGDPARRRRRRAGHRRRRSERDRAGAHRGRLSHHRDRRA